MVDSTNVRLRWSRQFEKSPMLQTFGSAGAGGSGDRRFYKHSAPLEPAIREPLYSLLFTLHSSLITHPPSQFLHSEFQFVARESPAGEFVVGLCIEPLVEFPAFFDPCMLVSIEEIEQQILGFVERARPLVITEKPRLQVG